MVFNPNPTFVPKPKTPDQFEQDLNLIVKNILSGYPEINELGRKFPQFLEEIGKSKQLLKAIKKGNFEGKENYTEVKYMKDNGDLYTFKNKQVGEKISIGHIVSGNEWNKKYFLNHDSFKEFGQLDVYNQYIKAFIESEVLAIINKYILEYEINKKGQHTKRVEAYEGIKKTKNTRFEDLPLGPKAEKIVSAFLTRLSLDNPDFEFEVVSTNAHQDVVFKIDLVLKFKRGYKGVKTTNTDIEETVKIQLTMETSKEKLLINHPGASPQGMIGSMSLQ
ncbi:MAG: hypothetical protein M3Q34_04490 [bacterium]|nr:hypothetical protein [bacterium]